MMSQAQAGSIYRAYNGDGDAGAHRVSYTVTCTDGGSSTSDFVPVWFKVGFLDTALPIMSADGTVLQGSLDVNDDHYEWNIHSVRE